MKTKLLFSALLALLLLAGTVNEANAWGRRGYWGRPHYYGWGYRPHVFLPPVPAPVVVAPGYGYGYGYGYRGYYRPRYYGGYGYRRGYYHRHW